ncbi:hypothetical protein N9L19_00590 [bacterium]|nr:hypothetical protein [bacterium]
MADAVAVFSSSESESGVFPVFGDHVEPGQSIVAIDSSTALQAVASASSSAAAPNRRVAALEDIRDWLIDNHTKPRRARGQLIQVNHITYNEGATIVLTVQRNDEHRVDVQRSMARSIKNNMLKNTTGTRCDKHVMDIMILSLVLHKFCQVTVHEMDIDELVKQLPNNRRRGRFGQHAANSALVVSDPELGPDISSSISFANHVRQIVLAESTIMSKGELAEALAQARVEMLKETYRGNLLMQEVARGRQFLRAAQERVDTARNDMKIVAEEACYRIPGLTHVSLIGKCHLGLCRNHGNVGATTALRMVASSALQGELKDYHIITKYEHRVAAAQRLMMYHSQQLCEYIIAAMVTPASHIRTISAIECVSSKAGATKQSSCLKKKMHLIMLMHTFFSHGTMNIASRALARMNPNASLEQVGKGVAAIGEGVCQRKVSPAMQAVHFGSGEELYRMILAEFQSVYVKTWEDRVQYSAHRGDEYSGQPRVIRFYAFAFDKGSENVGFAKRVKSRLESEAFMMHWAVWCIFHAYQLCVGNIISVVDTWDWTRAYNETTSTDIVVLHGPRRRYHQ